MNQAGQRSGIRQKAYIVVTANDVPRFEHSRAPNRSAPGPFDSLQWTDRQYCASTCGAHFVRKFVCASGVGEESIAQSEDGSPLHSREDSGAFKGLRLCPANQVRFRQSAVLNGVGDIVICGALHHTFRRRSRVGRLAATSHGDDAGAHHLQYTVWTQHFEQSIDLVLSASDFDGQ